MIIGKHKLYTLIKLGLIQIEPFNESLLTDIGYNVTVSREYAYLRDLDYDELRLDSDEVSEYIEKHTVKQGDSPYIHVPSKDVILLIMNEYIKLPRNICAILTLRSSLARLGLSIPPTVIDPCFSGRIVIELINNTYCDYYIPINAPICKLVFMYTEDAECYNGYYNNQDVTRIKPIKPIDYNNDTSDTDKPSS